MWMRMPAQAAPSVLPGSATWRSSAIIFSSLSVTALNATSLTRSRISRAVRGVPGRSIGIDRNEDRVLRGALAYQRRDGGIARITAVPVGVAIDLDRLEQLRQAGGGEQNLRGNLGIAEYPPAAGVYVGGGDKQFDRRARQPLEIDQVGQDLLQRICRQRSQKIRREHARHEIHGQERGREIQRPAAEQHVDRTTPQRAQAGGFRHAAPKPLQRLARAGGATRRVAVDQHGGVHRPGGGAGDAVDAQPLLFEQAVQHAPCKRPMGAPALQREIHQDRGSLRALGIGSSHRNLPS